MLCFGFESRIDAVQASLDECLVHLDDVPHAQGSLVMVRKELDGVCAPVSSCCDVKDAHISFDELVVLL